MTEQPHFAAPDDILVVAGDILVGSTIVGCIEDGTIEVVVRGRSGPHDLFIRVPSVSWMTIPTPGAKLALNLSGDGSEFRFPDCRRRVGGFEALRLPDGSYGQMAFLPKMGGVSPAVTKRSDPREL